LLIVPDPHRVAAPEAPQVRQRVLGQIPFSLNAIHGLQDHRSGQVGALRRVSANSLEGAVAGVRIEQACED